MSSVRLHIGIGIVAFCTLVLELSLIRVFDVILTPSMGYVVITAAIFALGLGGIYLYLFPITRERAERLLPWLYLAFALGTLLLLPTMNALPFDLNLGRTSLRVQLLAWLGMYVALIMPFFLSGLIISLILRHYSEQVHTLYFVDLVGAGLGCAVIIPIITPYGPGGIQFIVAALLLIGTAVFLNSRIARAALVGSSLVLAAVPAAVDGYLEYDGHADKRGVDTWRAQGLRDFVRWDPVSKLEVFRISSALNFAIDGGQQGSWLQRFNGDFGQFHREMEANPDGYFFGLQSVVHYLTQGKNTEVLVIGAAVGNEAKAAVLFGARRVDAIELVGEIVKAAKTRYARYSGDVFNHPRINYRVGEGRTYLRRSTKQYDVLQMFSNHTSSSIADGSGAVQTAYLQTVEAYMEYFSHMKPDGIIQINHHIYPRMLTTAAAAWQKLGKKDFSRHVLVVERWRPLTLPTMLIKMQPWTKDEVARTLAYMNRQAAPKVGLPADAKPSDKICRGNPFNGRIQTGMGNLDRIDIWVGTHYQDGLSYDVDVRLWSETGTELARGSIPGNRFKDNSPVRFDVPPLGNTRGDKIEVLISAEDADCESGFSVWMTGDGHPIITSRGEPRAYVIAFDPINRDHNLILAAFLDGPFPKDLGAQAGFDISPVSDDQPYFSMIRKKLGYAQPMNSMYMDDGTAHVLNLQHTRFIPTDWLNLALVGSIALTFSVIFIFLPLFFSRHGRARWEGMGWSLSYFSCLGAGFIIIELVLVQIFKKLIGYPTYTYVTVIFTMLIAAGIGSLAAKPLRVGELRSRWAALFVLILVAGTIFIVSYSAVFYQFLSQPLPIRIAVAVAMLFPLGFLMGMPLPIGIYQLGRVNEYGIPWAWGMNGFFTVSGGFLSILLSYKYGFQSTLMAGLVIYALAFFTFERMKRPGTVGA